MASRNYVFTCYPEAANELTAEEVALYYAHNLEELFSDDLFAYVIVNIEECPETKRMHWQGYMELTRPARYSAITSRVPLLENTTRFAARRGTQQQAIDYCKKTESRWPGVEGFFEYGTKAAGQGHRSDLEAVSELLRNGATEKQIAEELPGMYLRYHTGIAAYIELMEDDLQPDTDFQPRAWQQQIIDMAAEEPDDRTIVWVTDPQGGRGKTRLATHLIRSHGAIQLSGQIKDMTYAYTKNRAPIVVFDITRAAQDCTGHLFSMMEMLKSGRLFNTKYRSKQVNFKPPHVFVFSNHSWDREKLSHDRVKEINI